MHLRVCPGREYSGEGRRGVRVTLADSGPGIPPEAVEPGRLQEAPDELDSWSGGRKREVVETCARLELDALTLYAFSVENWKRPRFEIVTLMSLLKEYLHKELANLLKNDIRFRVVGRMNELDASVQKELSRGLAATSSCRGMTFNIALNYGGRTEIVDACRSLAQDVAAGRLTPEQIDEETLGSRLGTAGLPDPDLLIRTSGEMRISNFLLWQIAYSEIWVTSTLWPDFRKLHLFEGILEFQKRERRYGGVIAGGRSNESGEAAG